MKKYIIIFIVLVPLLFSCNKKQNKTYVNTNILDRKKFVDVLVDCYLVEGALIPKQQDGNTVKIYTKYYYDFIFQKHQINREQLFETMQYYCFRVSDLSKIYTDVQNKILTMKIPSNSSENY